MAQRSCLSVDGGSGSTVDRILLLVTYPHMLERIDGPLRRILDESNYIWLLSNLITDDVDQEEYLHAIDCCIRRL
jgi:hypothetical protein